LSSWILKKEIYIFYVNMPILDLNFYQQIELLSHTGLLSNEIVSMIII